jgi:hypothetical protein
VEGVNDYEAATIFFSDQPAHGDILKIFQGLSCMTGEGFSIESIFLMVISSILSLIFPLMNGYLPDYEASGVAESAYSRCGCIIHDATKLLSCLGIVFFVTRIMGGCFLKSIGRNEGY